MYSRTLLEREVLCRAGDQPKAVYCVVRGTLELVGGFKGSESMLGLGQVLGQLGGGHTEPHTVQAISCSEVFVLDNEMYRNCMQYLAVEARIDPHNMQQPFLPKSLHKMRENAKGETGSYRSLVDVAVLFSIWLNTIVLVLRLPYSLESTTLPVMYYVWDIMLHALLLLALIVNSPKLTRQCVLERAIYILPYELIGLVLNERGTAALLVMQHLPLLLYLKWTPEYLKSLSDQFYKSA